MGQSACSKMNVLAAMIMAAGMFSLHAETSFLVADTEYSRLEVVPGRADRVTVPLVRDETGAAVEYLVCAGRTNAVNWAEGESRAYPDVDVSTIAVGEDRVVSLLDSSRNLVASSKVHGVADPGNSVRNPWWMDERTSDELGWGEWTMDLDAAQSKVSSSDEDARVLVMVAGDLWCPHCQAALENLFETPQFEGWAKENHLALVSIDQADGKVPYTDWETAIGTFLNYNVDDLPYDGRHGASGASYLSRHGVSAADAKSVYERNLNLSMQEWKLPSSTAARLGNPTLLMLGPDGNVAARVALYGASDAYPVEENLARLTAALQLTDEKSAEPTWTELVHEIGTSEDVAVQINCPKIYSRLSGLAIGRLNLEYQADIGTEPVTVAVYSGSATNLALVAQGTGHVSVDISSEMYEADALWVSLAAFQSTKAYGASNVNKGRLVSELEVSPGRVAFVSSSSTFRESSKSAIVRLERSGGALGPAEVKIVHKGGTAENGVRYIWTDTQVSWSDGEDGIKEIVIPLIETPRKEGREKFTLKLSTKGLLDPAELGAKTAHEVTINDSTAPELEQEIYRETVYRGFSISQSYPVYNLTGGHLRLTRTGDLPKGLKLKYNASEKALVLSGRVKGSPGRFSVEVTLAENRASGVVVGQSSWLKLTVKDPLGFNPLVGQANRNVVIPLYDENQRLSGTVTVSTTTKGKISASYAGIKGKTSFSGWWTDLDESSGLARADLRRGDSCLTLRMSREGAFSAEIRDAKRGGIVLASLKAQKLCSSVADYVGLYTVTLPVAPEPGRRLTATGTAWMTLEARSTGRVRYKGMMPNGKSFGGMGTLLEGDEKAILPIFVSKGKGRSWLGATLSILPNAEMEYASGNPVIILSEEGTRAAWGRDDFHEPESSSLEVYGGYYKRGFDLVDCCLNTYKSTFFDVNFDASALLCDDPIYGFSSGVMSVGERGIGIPESTGGFVMKLAGVTGIVRGRAKLTWANGRKTSVPFKGVVLPGWTDCGCTPIPPPERPFISGTVYFNAKVNGRSVRCSIPVTTTPVY